MSADKIECNCPLCRNGQLQRDEVYFCIKSEGIFGIGSVRSARAENTPDVSQKQLSKIMNNIFDNINNN